ncbi:hypothetical protein ACFP2T_31190 [Plantactinospora solaniradicis]|uniref:Uncharacterized protein n=1 Tax=Plantactinospora solaniradicis TaxID=1723736 RepID=A0ABW1KHE3_9ACTN
MAYIDLQPGASLTRTERQQRWGGSIQDGIQRSSSTPKVFVWTKMEQAIDGVDVHYQYERSAGVIDDLKVKDHIPGADKRW